MFSIFHTFHIYQRPKFWARLAVQRWLQVISGLQRGVEEKRGWKGIRNEPCTPQHKLMVCQFFLKEKEKGKKAIFVSKCKTWKLKVEETQNHRDQIERKCGYWWYAVWFQGGKEHNRCDIHSTAIAREIIGKEKGVVDDIYWSGESFWQSTTRSDMVGSERVRSGRMNDFGDKINVWGGNDNGQNWCQWK